MTTPDRLAWVAGFWDGEGCVTTLSRYATPQFVVGQAGDEGYALCQRVSDWSGVSGPVHGPYLHGNRTKPYYMLRITGGVGVERLLELCRPWLSQTKVDQATRVLEAWHEYRRVNNVHAARYASSCRHGHPYDEGNTYITSQGWRRCRRCHADAENRRRAAFQAAHAEEAKDG